MNKARVLIVEDETIVAMHLKLILQRLGYECVGNVTSGEEAVEVALATLPDLVLMDIRLSGEIDGVEAARRILAAIRTRIVYTTAYADSATMRRAMESTAPVGYVLKPFVEQALRKTLQEAMGKAPAPPSGQTQEPSIT